MTCPPVAWRTVDLAGERARLEYRRATKPVLGFISGLNIKIPCEKRQIAAAS
jgi:hypothetical protein